MTEDGDHANNKSQAEASVKRGRVWRNSLDILVVTDAARCSGRSVRRGRGCWAATCRRWSGTVSATSSFGTTLSRPRRLSAER